MVSNKFWLVSMVFHGFCLVSMVLQGSFMGVHGLWLVSMIGSIMVFHGFHGFFLVSMILQSSSWFCRVLVGFHGFS